MKKARNEVKYGYLNGTITYSFKVKQSDLANRKKNPNLRFDPKYILKNKKIKKYHLKRGTKTFYLKRYTKRKRQR